MLLVRSGLATRYILALGRDAPVRGRLVIERAHADVLLHSRTQRGHQLVGAASGGLCMRERSLPISQVALRVYKLALQGGVLEAELSVVALRRLEEGHEIGRRGLHAAFGRTARRRVSRGRPEGEGRRQ